MPNFSAPWTSIPADFSASAWGRVLGDFDADSFATKLEAALPLPQNPALQKFRKKLLGFTPSFIDEGGTYSLSLEHPLGDAGSGSAYYLSPPHLATKLKCVLDHLGVLSDFSIAEFFSFFPRFREDFEVCGHFHEVGEWPAIEARFDQVMGTRAEILEKKITAWFANYMCSHDISMLSESKRQRIIEKLRNEPDAVSHWRCAWVIYHARNGDRILLHPDGGSAWFVTSEQQIRPIATSFSGFIDYLTDAIDQRWPLDSYGKGDR